MRKEPILFLLFAAFIAWQARPMFSDSAGSRSRRPRVSQKDYTSARVPDVGVALPESSREVELDRDLFAPPSPTSPLPPLDPDLPPLEPLGALAPPTGWGPSPAYYGSYLRRPERPEGLEEIPGLFDAELEEVEDGAGEELEGEAVEALELPDDPVARAARIAGLKKQYDWVQTNQFKWGRIQNPDRYTLRLDESPEVEFIEVDPVTGQPRFGGKSVTYKLPTLQDFGLVDNALTKVEVGLAKFDDPLAPSAFDRALDFADLCLLLRNETPRALEVAEELYGRAQAINVQDDPRPRLGLATCYQLGFRLEDAYDTYQDLLLSGHDTDAVVHARLGVLLDSLRMPEAARHQFEEALRVERTSWEARAHFGRFLMRQGDAEAAVEHLREAVLREPKEPEAKGFRVRIRNAYAGALLATGQMAEALDAFGTAVSADPGNETGMLDVGRAGLMSAARFVDGDGMADGLATGVSGDEPAAGGFELLLAAGLAALEQGDAESAKETLQLAVDADPFRSHEAHRALSRLAEITGNPEDAVEFVESALRSDPTDAWSLYQRGRLYEATSDDLEARAAYRAALDVELDLVPALERMAALLQEADEFDAAERYYERATSLEAERAILWSRRGWNALQSGDLALAETALNEARRLSPGLGSARAGLAWWHYASGDPAEAVTLFGEIVDDLRSEGREGPLSAFAQAQADRIADHDSKEVWRDRFDRANGRVGNGWTLDQGFGPLIDLADGGVRIQGQNERPGRTRIFQSLPPDRFLVFSAELTVGEEAVKTRSGLFISGERTRSGGISQVNAEIVVCRDRDGNLQVRVQQGQNDDEAVYREVVGPEWPIGQPIRVAIERVGEDLDSEFTLYVDGEPVVAGIECDRLLASRQPVLFGVFSSGDAGRRADVRVDEVRVVRRR